MNWFTTSALVIGLLIWFSRKGSRKEKVAIVSRTKTQALKEAKLAAIMASEDVEKMAAALNDISDPLPRHHLISAMVKGVYPKRKDAAAREQLYAYGNIYLDEFDGMAPAMKAHAAPEQMDVPVLKCLCIAMEEDQRYDEALDICRLALDWHLDDGTKTGYEGRMLRIKKKQAAREQHLPS
jgi:hypothetical protein